MTTGNVYIVKTNLPPGEVDRIGMEIFRLWFDFAMGKGSIGGKRLVYPTGRYAASLSYQRENETTVAIIADEGVAPEAAILEVGHGKIDLKSKLQQGRAYPLHRPVGDTAGTSLRRIGSKPPSRRPKMWAQLRGSTFSGFASFGPNSDSNSWIIPAMPAYSPAGTLARIAARMS